MQPIDLQTLFTQLDKVAKTQSLQKEGLQIQAAMQHVQSQKKAEEHIREVNEAQNMGEENKIRDDKSGRKFSHNEKEEDDEGDENNLEYESDEVKDEDSSLIRDPALGRNIDISG